ncbi:hypothetical protein L2D14_13475 [Thalassospiraceae bacterium LMO-JJ14]|nr:hypothetical protein L2D14_13475 [Thalassospiraceae bacterium LMO-JJ14]
MGKYHDKAQQDYSSSNGRRPEAPSITSSFGSSEQLEREVADRKDYEDGWRNADKQDRKNKKGW